MAGVDEVGRGALFGPVVAAAVVFPAGWSPEAIPGLRDSKRVKPEERERLSERVLVEALASGIGVCPAAAIDETGIVAATLRAMADALDALTPAADMVLIDGLGPLPRGHRGCAIVQADALCASTAAASIVAKVTRDRLVRALASCYPGYGLDSHVGYASAQHLAALASLGPTPLHRRSFAPVARSAMSRE